MSSTPSSKSNFQTQPNTGSLFENKKEGNSNQPDSTGNAVIDGKEYVVAAWNKTSKNGKPYQFLKYTLASEAGKYKKDEQTGNDDAPQTKDELSNPFEGFE